METSCLGVSNTGGDPCQKSEEVIVKEEIHEDAEELILKEEICDSNEFVKTERDEWKILSLLTIFLPS